MHFELFWNNAVSLSITFYQLFFIFSWKIHSLKNASRPCIQASFTVRIYCPLCDNTHFERKRPRKKISFRNSIIPTQTLYNIYVLPSASSPPFFCNIMVSVTAIYVRLIYSTLIWLSPWNTYIWPKLLYTHFPRLLFHFIPFYIFFSSILFCREQKAINPEWIGSEVVPFQLRVMLFP